MKTIYTSPKAVIRQELWDYLVSLGATICTPWLLLGDFNQVVDGFEKRRGRQLASNGMGAFRRMIDNCGLIDLGFVEPKFTWLNMKVIP